MSCESDHIVLLGCTHKALGEELESLGVVEVGPLERLADVASGSLVAIALSSGEVGRLARFGSNLGTVEPILHALLLTLQHLQVLRENANGPLGEARPLVLDYQEL